MNKERWEQVKAAFDQASEIKGAARSEFLEVLRSRDAELHQEVRSLLEASRESVRFLDDPAEME